MSFTDVKKEICGQSDPKRAKNLQWFFKTGPGEYGEGDVFAGITVPEARKIVKKFAELSLTDIKKLLVSKIHEERLIALLILVAQFEKGDGKKQKKIFDFYLNHTKYINNWDLVDLSAGKVVGAYLFTRPPARNTRAGKKDILYKLARSKNLWERRIAIIATSYFIKYDKFQDTLKLSKILLNDEHDLIHKAVGWMLREVGKRSLATEEKFLQKWYNVMPRTMLRYAIERFPEKKRKAYLTGAI